MGVDITAVKIQIVAFLGYDAS